MFAKQIYKMKFIQMLSLHIVLFLTIDRTLSFKANITYPLMMKSKSVMAEIFGRATTCLMLNSFSRETSVVQVITSASNRTSTRLLQSDVIDQMMESSDFGISYRFVPLHKKIRQTLKKSYNLFFVDDYEDFR